MEKKMKITHFITTLNGGGAESMLFKLLQNYNTEKYEITVISMLDKGVYGEKIENDLGISVYTLNIKNITTLIKSCFYSIKICKNTDVIQTWMYHANLLGFLVGKILNKKIIWGIHHNDLSKEKNKKSTILIAKLGAFLSGKVDKIIYCGSEVEKNHLKIGYNKFNAKVISNGFDTKIFSPLHKKDLKKDLNIDFKKRIILHVARWDPLKDYENLLSSLNKLRFAREDFIALLVGKNINYENDELVNLIKINSLENFVILLDRREDIPSLMASSDLFVSSSSGEGFPNVIGEAMSSGTLCVVTDAGDSKSIVGNYGKVVPISDSDQLYKAISESLDMNQNDYNSIVKNSRNRIIDNFSIESITFQYEKQYENLKNFNHYS